MSIRLSHSAIEMYKLCPKRYKMHYIDKYRSKEISSALFFGGYIGEVVQMMALDKKEELTYEEAVLSGKDPFEYFDELMGKVSINRVEHDLPSCELIKYYKSDYDSDLLEDEDIVAIDGIADELGMKVDGIRITFDQFYPSYKAGQLDLYEKKYMNFIFWLSLRRKGIKMIEAYRDEVVPRIVKIHSIEQKINLECDQDSLIGYIDMVCDYRINSEMAEKLDKNEDDVVKILLDHKTASVKFTAGLRAGTLSKIERGDAPQLYLYDYAEEVGTVGYIVMVKKIKKPKRGPKKDMVFCDVQMMAGKPTEEQYTNVLNTAGNVLEGITTEAYEPDTTGCMAFMSRCCYYEQCQEGREDFNNLYCGKK